MRSGISYMQTYFYARDTMLTRKIILTVHAPETRKIPSTITHAKRSEDTLKVITVRITILRADRVARFAIFVPLLRASIASATAEDKL